MECNQYKDTPIKVYGTKKAIEEAYCVLDTMELSGDCCTDTLLIQQAMDEGRLKAEILYAGKTVYPYKKLVKEFQKFIKNNSIEHMSKLMYKFLHLNFDIAHYNINGYIDYYEGRWDKLYTETLSYEFSRPYYSRINDSTGKIVAAVKDILAEKDVVLSAEPKKKPKKAMDSSNSNTIPHRNKKSSNSYMQQMSLLDFIA